MPRSMTGFGGGLADEDGLKAKVEIRALNHRFLEVTVRVPRPYLSLEDKIRREVNKVVFRGHLDIFVTIDQEKAKNRVIRVDRELVRAYHDHLGEIAQYLDIPVDISLRDIMALPGSLELVEEIEDDASDKVWPVVCKALTQGLEQLVSARTREGERLAEDLRARLHRLESYVAEIDCQREAVLAGYRQRLQGRTQELLGSVMVNGDRLLQEIVLFAERSDVTEEIVRLCSHFEGIIDSLQAERPVGRKLDFLVQEIHREVSTIGAKAAGGSIGQLVVACKEEIEKIREQVQNLE